MTSENSLEEQHNLIRTVLHLNVPINIIIYDYIVFLFNISIRTDTLRQGTTMKYVNGQCHNGILYIIIGILIKTIDCYRIVKYTY